MEYGYPQLQNNLEVCMFHTTVFDIGKKQVKYASKWVLNEYLLKYVINFYVSK